ncbi:MAG TPA: MerR family transcriptional regulator [Caulobacteraceae bacterium]|nr:MerR family transcriptional regulator [Caulobacteraceae bacterium]
MSPPSRYFSPAETARRLKVSTKALRLYETLGLVDPLRTSTGWRTYGPDQMVRLHQVLAMKHLGVPLKRARELLGDQLADLDAVLQLQEAAFRARMADDARRLELVVAVRRRLASGETLSVDDLIHLTRETVMTDPIEGRLATVQLRVADKPRAAAWFGDLFGWTFTEAPGEGSAWSHTASGVVDKAWALALTDAASAPSVRLGFEVDEPAEALALATSLGGAGGSPDTASDDQGLPLAFFAPQAVPPPSANRHATGELGVVVALVNDTARAKAFYGGLFGDGFHQIGPQDRWWSTQAAFGIFSNALAGGHPARQAPGDAPEVHVFVCVRDLAEHQDRVRSLGGAVLTESRMGPYEVCACHDDQGTRFHLWRDPARY